MDGIERILGADCAIFCPELLNRALRLLRGKWAVPVLVTLGDSDAPLRYGVLQRRLEIPSKELSRILRLFDDESLVSRTVHPTVPPQVDYALLDRGRALSSVLRPLAEWSLLDRASCVPDDLS